MAFLLPGPSNNRYGVPPAQYGVRGQYRDRRPFAVSAMAGMSGMGAFDPTFPPTPASWTRGGSYDPNRQSSPGQPAAVDVIAQKAKVLSALSDLSTHIVSTKSMYSQAAAQAASAGIGAANQDLDPIKAQLQSLDAFVVNASSYVNPIAPAEVYSPSSPWGDLLLAEQSGLGSVTDRINAALAILSQLHDQLVTIQGNISAAVAKASSDAANAAAAAAAAKAQQDATNAANKVAADAAANAAQANNQVTQAIVNAQSLSGVGNYDGALAALNNPSVVQAAASIGRTGDLTAQIASISTAKVNAQNAAQAQASAQQASAQAAATAQAQASSNAQLQIQLAQMQADEAQRAREFEATRQDAATAAAAAASQQTEALKLLPTLLQAFQPSQVAATPQGGPSPIVLALIQALTSGQNPLQALLAALQNAQGGTATSSATPPDGTPGQFQDGSPGVWSGGVLVPAGPSGSPSLQYAYWGTTERF